MTTPVYVICGFLGSGKTTLLNHLLRHVPQDTRLAVIVNEFGTLSIDGKLIENRGYPLVEMASGCICCTLRSNLLTTIRKIIADHHPNLIVVEASGLAAPAQLAQDIGAGAAFGIRFGGAVGVVNAATYLKQSEALFVVDAQIADASHVIVNKTDLVGEKETSRVCEKVQTVAGVWARVHETTFGQVDWQRIFTERTAPQPVSRTAEGMEQAAPQKEHAYHASFASRSVTGSGITELSALTTFYRDHAGSLVRSKGIVNTENGWKIIQWTTDGMTISDYDGINKQTELVIIGPRSTLDLACEMLTGIVK